MLTDDERYKIIQQLREGEGYKAPASRYDAGTKTIYTSAEEAAKKVHLPLADCNGRRK